MPSPCPDAQELQQALQGQRGPWDVERLARHVETCARCADAADRLLDEETFVVALRVPGEAVQAEGDTVRRLIAQMRELQPSSQPSRTLRPSISSSRTTSEHIDELLATLAPALEADELGRLGEYGVLSVLGGGGMGVVFAARQTQPRRTVALKVAVSVGRSGRQRARFHTETEVVARLRHPNIVQVYEVGEHQGLPFFTMEHLEGGSLAQKLAALPLTARDAAELTRTLAGAAHFAHGQGFVHRDLKPANVLLSADGTPQIADFGLAKQFDDAPAGPAAAYQTETGVILGTPGYMAPEQAEGKADVGPAADVYALGAILYECLTGRPPFKAATVLETLEQVRTQEPVSPSRLQPKTPRELDIICLKCLEKQPARRYPTAQALADDLGRYQRGEPIHARSVSPVTRLAKWARRSPSLAALVAVSGLSLVTLVAGSLAYQAQLRDALAKTEAKEAEARRQEQRADANYREARDTVKRMLDRADKRAGTGAPKLQELRREQQEDALAFFLKLGEQKSDDPDLRFESARAHHEAGLLQRTLGRPEEAARNFAQAEEMLAALAAEFPDERLYRYHHGETLKLLGALGQLPPAEGENCLRRAMERAEGLVREEPWSVEYRVQQADVRITLGGFFFLQEKKPEAEDHFTQAIALYETLASEQPGEPHHRLVLAKAYLNLSIVMQATGRSAKELHDKAEATLEQLHREKPEDEVILESLAILRANWAYQLLLGDKKPEAALADLAKNVTMLNEALRREPSHAVLRRCLYQTHGVRGQVFEMQERFAESAEEFRRVIELSPSPAQADFHRLFLAMTYARAGKHDPAFKEIEDWGTRVTPTTPENQLVYAAQVYCKVIEVVRRDESLSSLERDERVPRCESRALDMLRAARKVVGEPGWKKSAPALRKDDQLRLLWGNDEFKRLTDVE